MIRSRILCAVASLSVATAGHAGTLCPWDCNAAGGDGTVGISDFLLLLAQWGGPGSCDIDGGGVGITDFLGLLANWGPCPVGGACCNPGDGSCQEQTPADCTAAGGVYGGDRTDCADSDADRIPDVFELNTCESVGPCFAGSDPGDTDTDDDQINDGDEFYGTTNGLDLPALGLDPCHQDLLIETDWVHTTGQPADRNKLHVNQVNRLVASFANSGVANPDGVTGITLHLDYGQAPYSGGNSVLDPNNDTTIDVNSGFSRGEYYEIKDVNFAPNRHGYFHYSLMCDRYSINGHPTGSSGLGELPGDDTIVSMGQYALGDDNRIGNIVMHEWGHNFNLGHGGFENRNYKPSSNSVMNYAHQFCGADGDFDSIPDGLANFSHGVNIALFEFLLTEADGVTGVGPAIDWNNDGDAVDTIDRNINCPLNSSFFCDDQTRNSASCGTLDQCWDNSCDVLSDFNDWGAIHLLFNDPDFGPREVIHCLLDAPALIVGGDED